MQEGRILKDQQINKELLTGIFDHPALFFIIINILGIFVLAAAIAIAIMVNKGIGVSGLNRPVMWGFFITNFVFWVGISHAGVMLSAILRLSKAEWRRPATRAAEVLTLFSLMFLLILLQLLHLYLFV